MQVLVVVDQHAADERILLEELQAKASPLRPHQPPPLALPPQRFPHPRQSQMRKMGTLPGCLLPWLQAVRRFPITMIKEEG